jgi:ketosteroid isomerase-like protein
MSEQDVANLRSFLDGWDPKADLEAWKRGEPRGTALFDPDVAYEDTILPDHVGETYRGYDGIARATERWLKPFDTLATPLDRVVGDGEVLVSIHRVHAKAHHTGMEFAESLAYLWTFRDGKVMHLKSYWDPADALEAAGLTE